MVEKMVSKENLVEKIREKTARIAVLGLGRVGLPTAVMFADAGYEVIGVDVKKERVDAISSMKCPMKERGLDELLKRVIRKEKLKATTNAIYATRKAHIAVICVQTPITKNKKPNITHLLRACKDVAEGLAEGKLVIVESTVPPGTMTNQIARALEKKELKCGKDFWLAYCPETIATGNALQEFVENPRIVGGYNYESTEIVTELLKTVTKGEIAMTDCKSAEIAKLAGNTFRDVNIAFVNELALICEQIGVDVMEVIALVGIHPRAKNIHKPGPGVGGPCLTKDPYLLLHPVKEKGFRSTVISSSRMLNEKMPDHIIDSVMRTLNEAGKDVKKLKIAVLGSAYKAEVDDATNSPAERIIKGLIKTGAKIQVYDPYSRESFGTQRAGSLREAIKGAHCTVITIDHKMFKRLDLKKTKELMKDAPIIVDCKRVVDPSKAKKLGFVYVGTGYNM